MMLQPTTNGQPRLSSKFYSVAQVDTELNSLFYDQLLMYSKNAIVFQIKYSKNQEDKINLLPEFPLSTGVLLGLGTDCTVVMLSFGCDWLKKSTSFSSGLETVG